MMKKFLSSLLALTMILSLVIVPARADNSINGTIDGGTLTIINATNDSIAAKVGDPVVTLQASLSGATLKYGDNTVTNPQTEYTWAVTRGNAVTISGDKMSIVKKGDATIQCTATMTGTYTPQATGSEKPTPVTVTAVKTATATVTVTDPDGEANAAFQNAITDITYNGRKCEINKSKTNVTYYKYEGDLTDTWGAQAGSAYENIRATASDNKLTVRGKLREGNKPVTAVFTLTKGTISLTINSSITGKPATDSEKVIVGGDLDLTAVTKGVDSPYHEWKLGSADQNNKGATFTFNTKEVAAPQTVTCNIYDKSTDGKTLIATASCKVEVVKDEWALEVSPSSAKLTEKGQKETFTAKLMPKFGSAADAKITFTTADNSIITLKDNKAVSYTHLTLPTTSRV